MQGNHNMNSYKEIWDLVLRELEKKYSESLMDLWFRNLELVHLDDKYAFILSNDENFFVNLLNTKYAPHIKNAFEELGFDVEVKIFSRKDYSLEGAIFSMESPRAEEPEPVKEDAYSDEAYSYKSAGISDYDNEYTFENFVVGSTNRFAHAVSVAVANHPAEQYNPLLIYGPSGIGKTHLMKAIAHQLKINHPEFKIVFVKSEDFTNELINSLTKQTMPAFREKYRNVDVLLLDDVQFIAGKNTAQEEFFHTFVTLFDNHKQIVLASDRHPSEIQKLEERIRTRFEGGMLADIQSPDTELRIAILKKKSEMMNISLPSDVLNFIGENIKNNIRQIEGVLKKLGAYSYVNGVPITLDVAKEQLSGFISVSTTPAEKAEKIIEEVSKIYNVPVEDIKSTKRPKEISTPRHIAVYVVRKITNLSVVDIGKIFNRDYSTIISSINKISKEISTDRETERVVNGLIKDFS